MEPLNWGYGQLALVALLWGPSDLVDRQHSEETEQDPTPPQRGIPPIAGANLAE